VIASSSRDVWFLAPQSWQCKHLFLVSLLIYWSFHIALNERVGKKNAVVRMWRKTSRPILKYRPMTYLEELRNPPPHQILNQDSRNYGHPVVQCDRITGSVIQSTIIYFLIYVLFYHYMFRSPCDHHQAASEESQNDQNI
jgi:hypothetical protein